MAYGNKYILSFSNELNEFYEIFFDYLSYTGGSYPIIGAETTFTIKSNSDEEDRFAPILGLQCDINIFAGTANTPQGVVDDSTLTIFDLIASQDNQIRITIYKDNDHTKSFFQGFVVVQDNSQDYQDPPFNLTITALDGLGLLKGIDFLDTTGAAYVGSFSPVKWLGQMLYKTGQKLNLRVYFNILNITFPLIPCIESFTINVNTFLTGQPQATTDPTIDIAASIADDCYGVIEKICRNLRCRLFQQDGVWNLVNFWEYQNPNGYTYVEYIISEPTAGIVSVTPMSSVHNEKYDSNVGSDQIIHPVKDDAKIWLRLATKSEKFTYTYDQSLNKICNQSFDQGNPDVANNGTIPSSVVDPTITPPITFNYNAFFPFCWTLAQNASVSGAVQPKPFPEAAQSTPIYIRQIVDSNNYSYDRYLVIKSSPTPNHVRSSTFLIDQGDAISVSVDMRMYQNGSITNAGVMMICLAGIDGSFWAFGSQTAILSVQPLQWIPVDSNYQIGGYTPFIPRTFIPSSDATQWATITAERDPTTNVVYKAPVSGDMFIILQGFQDLLGGLETWFKNLNVTITPILQGSFTPIKGDFNYSSSNSIIKQTDSQDVEISDSPKRYFKGAILQTDGKSLMPPTWVRNGISGQTPQRFTQLMEQIIYNGVYRQFQKIEGTMRGLTWVDSTLTVREAGFINSYYFTNHPVPTKKFILTSFENDYGTGYGRRVFIEILNDQNDTGQVSPDNYIFQYLFQ